MKPFGVLTLLAALAAATPAMAESADVGVRACATLGARVDAVAGGVPVFLRSYDHADGEGPNAEPALNGAFTYDNALATIQSASLRAPIR